MTKHADRDKSEQPVWPPHARAAYLDEPVPYVPAESADDERVAKYAKAITPALCEQFYDDGQVAESLRGFDWQSDVARAVMAVADAEMAALWIDLERHEIALERMQRDAQSADRAHDAQKARAEAAEAKVARVEALAATWATDDEMHEDFGLDFDAGIRWTPRSYFAPKLRAALDGAE